MARYDVEPRIWRTAANGPLRLHFTNIVPKWLHFGPDCGKMTPRSDINRNHWSDSDRQLSTLNRNGDVDVCVRLVVRVVENKTVVELSILSQFGTLLLNKPNTDRSNENTHFVYHVYKRQSHTCGCFSKPVTSTSCGRTTFWLKAKKFTEFQQNVLWLCRATQTCKSHWLVTGYCLSVFDKSLQNIGPGCHFSKIWTRSGTMLVKCSLLRT